MGTQLCIFSGYDNVMTVMWFGVVVSFMCKKEKKKCFGVSSCTLTLIVKN